MTHECRPSLQSNGVLAMTTSSRRSASLQSEPRTSPDHGDDATAVHRRAPRRPGQTRALVSLAIQSHDGQQVSRPNSRNPGWRRVAQTCRPDRHSRLDRAQNTGSATIATAAFDHPVRGRCRHARVPLRRVSDRRVGLPAGQPHCGLPVRASHTQPATSSTARVPMTSRTTMTPPRLPCAPGHGRLDDEPRAPAGQGRHTVHAGSATSCSTSSLADSTPGDPRCTARAVRKRRSGALRRPPPHRGSRSPARTTTPEIRRPWCPRAVPAAAGSRCADRATSPCS